MKRSNLLIVMIVSLVIGFGAGFALRPKVFPPSQTIIANSPTQQATRSGVPRGTQYFEANISEAREVVAACRKGTIRGNECTNAETAIVTVESKERFKRFRTDQR